MGEGEVGCFLKKLTQRFLDLIKGFTNLVKVSGWDCTGFPGINVGFPDGRLHLGRLLEGKSFTADGRPVVAGRKKVGHDVGLDGTQHCQACTPSWPPSASPRSTPLVSSSPIFTRSPPSRHPESTFTSKPGVLYMYIYRPYKHPIYILYPTQHTYIYRV